jgi:hypothetical protein
MALRIVRIHLEGGSEHWHISELEYYTDEDSTRTKRSRLAIVNWIESNNANVAYTAPQVGTGQRVYVRQEHGVKFLQTIADSKWSNNLLALPRY